MKKITILFTPLFMIVSGFAHDFEGGLNTFGVEPNNNWAATVVAKPGTTYINASSNVLKLTAVNAT